MSLVKPRYYNKSSLSFLKVDTKKMAQQLRTVAFRGPGFESQHPHGSSQPAATPLRGVQCAPLVSLGTICLWYTDIHSGKTL